MKSDLSGNELHRLFADRAKLLEDRFDFASRIPSHKDAFEDYAVARVRLAEVLEEMDKHIAQRPKTDEQWQARQDALVERSVLVWNEGDWGEKVWC